MAAFLGISLWIALATIIPGLITISVLYGAFVFTGVSENNLLFAAFQVTNDWVATGLAVMVMVLTQGVGILLESFLVKNQLLGPKRRKVEIPKGIDPCGETHFDLEPYAEYRGLYLLLAELRENEDTQGHLQRTLAQFFLTNNVLVSFGLGLVVTIWRTIHIELLYWPNSLGYAAFLVICLIVIYRVAYIRFDVMTKALWAARRRRLQAQHQNEQPYLQAQLEKSKAKLPASDEHEY